MAADDVERITVVTHPRWLKVCDIKEPRTGLEVKFSYAHLAAMVVKRIDTASDRTYTDGLAADPSLRSLAKRVVVSPDETLNDTTARVTVDVKGGRPVSRSHDLAAPQAEDALERGLRAKAAGLLGREAAERLWGGVGDIERLSARDLGGLLAG